MLDRLAHLVVVADLAAVDVLVDRSHNNNGSTGVASSGNELEREQEEAAATAIVSNDSLASWRLTHACTTEARWGSRGGSGRPRVAPLHGVVADLAADFLANLPSRRQAGKLSLRLNFARGDNDCVVHVKGPWVGRNGTYSFGFVLRKRRTFVYLLAKDYPGCNILSSLNELTLECFS